MDSLRDARIVLKILKENGYEGYIVGGAVRDYLLKLPLSDIDITTNAKPFQVLNMFKGSPTGIKYGTVTINFKDSEFEVTTYRSEEGYDDNRRPNEVIYEDDVLKDIQRRDFTMNSLLMDDTGLIHDHFDGMKDIRHKYIKTVGNATERFQEDALRMLRAFYFQSKLGFNLDEETKQSIKENRELVKNLAAERVLNEFIKTIQGKHLKLALSNMMDTKMHELLPGLKDGIEHIVRLDEMPFVDAFFATAFTLNGRVPSYWKFSNKHRHMYRSTVKLAKKTTNYGAKELYEYGLEICLLANRVNYILGKDTIKANEITNDFNNLPINSSLDLKFRGRDILKLTERKPGAWVNKLETELVNLVLDKRLNNDKEELKKFVEENYERF